MLEKASVEFKSAANEIEADYHWSAFLKHYKNICSTIVANGKKHDVTRAAAWQLQNEQKNDPVLWYLKKNQGMPTIIPMTTMTHRSVSTAKRR